MTFRSETYSSTASSIDGAVSTFAGPLESEQGSARDGRVSVAHQVDGRPRSNLGRRASGAGVHASSQSHRRQSENSGRRGSKSLPASGRRASKTSRDNRARDDLEDIPRSDWGRTLDTTISIPEGPEERADEHEANASLEMMDGSIEIMTSRGHRERGDV